MPFKTKPSRMTVTNQSNKSSKYQKWKIWKILKPNNLEHLVRSNTYLSKYYYIIERKFLFSLFGFLKYLDYDLCENKLWELESKIIDRKRKTIYGVDISHVVIIFELALFSALMTYLLQVLVESTFEIKYEVMREILLNYYEKPIICYFIYIIVPLVPTFFASIIVIYIEPKVPGSGVPMLKRYLNGLLIEDYFSIRVLIFKVASLLLTMLGGFAGGQEGPLFHICSLVACQITKNNFLTLNAYLTDNEKRDYLLLAVAVAIVLAFSSVVGSALLIFEEISNFWHARLLFTIFYTGYFASFVFTWMPGTNYNVYNMPSLEDFKYELYEIPLIVTLGVFVGLMGSLWNNIFQGINVFRKKYYKKKYYRIFDTLVLSAVIQSCSFFHFVLALKCESVDEYPLHHHKGAEIRAFCPKGTYESTATFWLLDPGAQTHELFIKKDPAFIFTTLYLYVFYFLTSACTTGSATTIGTFAPAMNNGALAGLLFCFLCINVWPNSKDFYPPKYALFGMVANLAALFRISISAIAIGVGLSGINVGNVFPLAACLLSSLYVANIFSEGFYEIPNRTFAMVSWEIRACLKGKVATDIMSVPVISFNNRETAGYILETLRRYPRYSCFTVVKDYEDDDRSTGVLIGTISTIQLLVIISEKYYLDNFDDWEPECTLRKFRQRAKSFFDTKKRYITIPYEEEERIVDLTWFMNPYPCRVNVRNSCTELLNLFRGLNYRTIIVIDTNGKPLGIITRLDFICNYNKSKRHTDANRIYKMWSQMDSMDLSILKV